jgi:hypothetical protein
MILEVAALLCTGVFAGAAIYVSAVEHPARLQCGTGPAVAEFRPSYKRAAVMQAALAALGCVAAVGAWMAGRGAIVLAAGLLLGAAIPFTLVVIRPVNARLLDPALDGDSAEAAVLLARWGRLHGVRTLLGAAAFALLALDRALAS